MRGAGAPCPTAAGGRNRLRVQLYQRVGARAAHRMYDVATALLVMPWADCAYVSDECVSSTARIEQA